MELPNYSASNEEVERKILNVSLDDMTQRIEKIQATLEFFREKFHAIWVENISWVRYRIRSEWNQWVRQEYKEKQSSWYQKETPLNINDTLEEALAFAQAIWFKKISETLKIRTQWVLQYKNHEVKILVDEFQSLRWLTNVSPIAEIESDNEEIVFEVGEMLWFERKDLVRMWENALYDLFSRK